jgi:hypothetical protein
MDDAYEESKEVGGFYDLGRCELTGY